ncbi:BZ3500_MvSof-1268-A1-R1_Chr2-1g04667 [Microbotryum saponariae]|uniref:BZ3500_MvSof-1268-A1-R1_Chr2-1g04667 protein n=1 Tax=Microbotryum saponariae TaxID=289078 RepID=A0A2X0KM49_9BASI|nr:BZ3500_MvSof-1268-A1-R1_Chr2-1g04667 [Microbotryum saponariae]SCZ92266.1 BZ3501_MvSof-1269-A2-R1_Chr2-1g04323 [Microbotryum saponariae]
MASGATARPDYVQLETHYNGIYVFVAYVIAVVGAWTTLELLLRRTGGSAKWNAVLLVGAGVSFGSTATWGMHFVGNQAVTLHYPPPSSEPPRPLSYNVGYTLLSLVVACLSMVIAFSFIGLRLDGRRKNRSGSDVGQTDEEYEYVLGTPELELEVSKSRISRGDDKARSEPPERATAGLPGGAETAHPSDTTPKHGVSKLSHISLPGRTKGRGSRKQSNKNLDEEEDDGEFGVVPASVSVVGVAKILGAGCICGGGIAAMHYVGQLAINRLKGVDVAHSVPRVTNTPYLIFLSILIAMVAVSVGLFLLFVVLRPKLEHRWYKRAGIAMILAVGTTLMHFGELGAIYSKSGLNVSMYLHQRIHIPSVALLGTQYYAIQGLTSKPATTSRNLILALVSVVAPVCCLSLLVFAVIGQQRLLRRMAARQRIVVATAVWDGHGRLLVREADGLLPSSTLFPKAEKSKPTGFLEWLGLRNRLSLESSNKKLGRFDHAFVALLRASWAWKEQSLATVTRVGSEVGATHGARRGSTTSSQADVHARDYGAREFVAQAASAPLGRPSLPVDLETDDQDEGHYGLKSQEGGFDDDAYHRMRSAVLGFEVAGREIATELVGSPVLSANGVLFDQILNTGHFEVSSRDSGDRFTVTQGQLLMLTRRIRSRAERDALLARSYTFVEPAAAARVTATAFAVPTDRVYDHFRDAHRFARFMSPRRYTRGRLYGAALVVQALPGEGLQLVVDEKQHHSLPMVELASLVRSSGERVWKQHTSLPLATLDGMLETVRQLQGRTLLELVQSTTPFTPESAQIHSLLVHMLRPFLDRVFSSECMDFLLPRLVVIPTLIPLTTHQGPIYGADGLTADAYLVCLKAVVPSAVNLAKAPLNWIPYSLHKAQNDCIARYERQRRAKSNLAAETTQHDSSSTAGSGSASGSVESPSRGHINQGFSNVTTVLRKADASNPARRESIHSHTSDYGDTTDFDEEAGEDVADEALERQLLGLPAFNANFVEDLIRGGTVSNNLALPIEQLRQSSKRKL